MTTLRFEDFQLREGHWVIADLRGKGGHIRTIPVPAWVKQSLYAQGDLGNRKGKCKKLWFGYYRAARLATDLCTTMPSGGRRAGTNSVPVGSCLNPDDRAILCAVERYVELLL